MRSLRTTTLAGALALTLAPGLAFAACAGHQSADADDGVTVATEPAAPQTPMPDKSVKPDDQQAMGQTSKPAEPAQDD